MLRRYSKVLLVVTVIIAALVMSGSVFASTEGVASAAPSAGELSMPWWGWPLIIVMGSHGRTGLKRLLMGSVISRVIGHAPCSVLAVKEKK